MGHKSYAAVLLVFFDLTIKTKRHFQRCYSLLVTSITQAMGEISGHLKDVLVEFKVPDAEQDELSAIIQSLQPAIVDRPDEKKLNKDVPADR